MSEVSNVNDNKNLNMRSQRIGSPADGQKIKGLPHEDSINSGMNVGGSQVNVGPIKPVDSKTLGGSYPGDHRAQPGDVARATVDRASDNGGPRSPMGQHPLSGRTPAAPAPQSFLGAEGSDRN